MTHILARLTLGLVALAVRCSSVLIQLTKSARASGSSAANLAVNRRAKRGNRIIVLGSFGPISTGLMRVQNNTLNILGVIGVFGIVAGDLKLQSTARRDLHSLKTELQSIIVISKLFACEFTLKHFGKHKVLLFYHCVIIVVIHIFITPC